ncbi:hypothetical protein [Shewanella atlantica]|uniref:hypothetical protein n=1 Tax=Shewanella atlantica TaxID=271099 RepID=UPI003736FD0F
MCQMLATGTAFSVQYPGGEHPMGGALSHHHVHGTSHSVSDGADQATLSVGEHKAHGHGAFNATEPVNGSPYLQPDQASNLYSTEVAGSATASDAPEAEHEHANHSHTPSHPPVDAIFKAEFFQSDTLIDHDISYLNLGYAPPIPPPYS